MIYYAMREAALSGLKHLYIVINKRKLSLRFGSSPALSQIMPLYERFEQDTVGVVSIGKTEAQDLATWGYFSRPHGKRTSLSCGMCPRRSRIHWTSKREKQSTKP
jgi:hypothetical protein